MVHPSMGIIGTIGICLLFPPIIPFVAVVYVIWILVYAFSGEIPEEDNEGDPK